MQNIFVQVFSSVNKYLQKKTLHVWRNFRKKWNHENYDYSNYKQDTIIIRIYLTNRRT